LLIPALVVSAETGQELLLEFSSGKDIKIRIDRLVGDAHSVIERILFA
jgi:hypothetical protein